MKRRNNKQQKNTTKISQYSKTNNKQSINTSNKEKDDKQLLYINQMEKLLHKIEANKIYKMVKEIRGINKAFHQYLNENRLNIIKYEDYLKFEDSYSTATSLGQQVQENETKTKNRKKLDEIKFGFHTLKEKMEEFQVIDFISQIKYTSVAIKRELSNLDKFGYEYEGIHLVNKPEIFTDQIFKNQKQYGIYKDISKYTIRKSQAIQEISNDFYYALKQQ